MVSIAGKSGGVLTVMCPHSTCLGFKVMYLHEGPSDYVQFLRSWKHIRTICIVDFVPHVARHGEKQFPGMFAPFGGKLTNPKNPQILEFIKSGGLVSHEELWTPKSVIPAPLVNLVHPVTNTPFKYVCFDRFHEVNSTIPIDILHRLDICVQLKNKINTSACEQTNKELSRYQSSLTNMSGHNFILALTYINLMRKNSHLKIKTKLETTLGYQLEGHAETGLWVEKGKQPVLSFPLLSKRVPDKVTVELTLQNWVSRVSRIPGGIFGKLGGFSKSSLHVAALTKI